MCFLARYSAKISVTFFSLLGLFSASIAEAETNTFSQALQQTTTSGQLRFAYISLNPDVSAENTTSATAIGGQLKFETAKWNRLQFAIAPYFSGKVEALSGDETQNKLNGDFFDSNNDSFSYLGEAYINYAWSNGNARLGRQQIDNPFINTDDIRMLPNTFDAVWFTLNTSDKLMLEAGFVQRWAGFDSGGSQDKFKDASNDSVSAVGITSTHINHHTLQAWYYSFDKAYSLGYGDGVYRNGGFEGAVQYASYSEDNASGIDGSAWGLSASYTYNKLTLSAAVNESSNDAGKFVDNGLSGGNFFTSMDETTIEGITDASAYVAAIDFTATENLSLSITHGHFEDGTKTSIDIDEQNFALSYKFSDKTDLLYRYTTVDNNAAPTDSGTNFRRQILQINYNF